MTLRRLLLLPLLTLLVAADRAPGDFAADARSIEALVNANYAYLDRFPGEQMPMTAKLRAEAERVSSARELVRYSERALALLADHHAITGGSLPDSWALVPSYSDLWVERVGPDYVITAVRRGSPAEGAGIRRGDRLLAVAGQPTAQAVADFWLDLGLALTDERAGYAARVLAAGKRNSGRRLTIGSRSSGPRELALPNLYQLALADRQVLTTGREGAALLVQFNDSLSYDATVAAFDAAMAQARPGQPVVIDLTDTPSGGNTTIARAVLGWFVDRPTAYQIHNLPAEERRTGVARQWIEQALPRPGKRHRGPVTVRVGRWTGSMGEGLAIAFDALGARVEGDRMAGLLGAIYDHKLKRSGQVIKLPTERLYHVNGSPREAFVPKPPR